MRTTAQFAGSDASPDLGGNAKRCACSDFPRGRSPTAHCSQAREGLRPIQPDATDFATYGTIPCGRRWSVSELGEVEGPARSTWRGAVAVLMACGGVTLLAQALLDWLAFSEFVFRWP